jgi:hypothetical protein
MVVAVIHYGAPFESFVENPLAELRVEREQPLAKSRIARQPLKRGGDIRIEPPLVLKGRDEPAHVDGKLRAVILRRVFKRQSGAGIR